MISPRIIPNRILESNKNAVDWGWQNLVAYGCGNSIIISEPEHNQIIQTLDFHQHTVTSLTWIPPFTSIDISNVATQTSPTDDVSQVEHKNAMKLLSGDEGGTVVLWDVTSATIQWIVYPNYHPSSSNYISQILSSENAITQEKKTHEGCGVAKLELINKSSLSTSGSHYLLIFYLNKWLVLWDISSNSVKWKKEFTEEIDMMTVSYFPRNYLNFIYPLSFASSSGWFYQTSGITDSTPPTVTEKYRISSENNKNSKGEIKQVMYSRCRNDILFILLSREILVMDTSLHTVLQSIELERGKAIFLQMSMNQFTSNFIVLHQNGAISSYDTEYYNANRAEDPMIDNIRIGDVNKSNFNRLLNSHQYKLDLYTEFQRNIKTIKLPNNSNSLNCSFFGISASPFHLSSQRFCITSSDGSIWHWEQKNKTQIVGEKKLGQYSSSNNAVRSPQKVGGKSGRITLRGRMETIGYEIISISSQTFFSSTANHFKYSPVVALGTSNGMILTVNLKNYTVDSKILIEEKGGAVRGLKWIDPETLICFIKFEILHPQYSQAKLNNNNNTGLKSVSKQSVVSTNNNNTSGSGGSNANTPSNPNIDHSKSKWINNIYIVDVLNGKVKKIRSGNEHSNDRESERGGSSEVSFLRSIEISSNRRYFSLLFSDKFIEIWDAINLKYIRSFSPPTSTDMITAMTWNITRRSNNNNKNNNNNKVEDDEVIMIASEKYGASAISFPFSPKVSLYLFFPLTASTSKTTSDNLINLNLTDKILENISTISAMSWRGKYLALGDVTGAIFLLYFDVVNNYNSSNPSLQKSTTNLINTTTATTNNNTTSNPTSSLRSSDNKIEIPNKATSQSNTSSTPSTPNSSSSSGKPVPKISVKLKFIKRVNTNHGFVRKLKFCPTHIDPSLSILALFSNSQLGLYQLSPPTSGGSQPPFSSDSSNDLLLSPTTTPSVPSFTRNIWKEVTSCNEIDWFGKDHVVLTRLDGNLKLYDRTLSYARSSITFDHLISPPISHQLPPYIQPYFRGVEGNDQTILSRPPVSLLPNMSSVSLVSTTTTVNTQSNQSMSPMISTPYLLPPSFLPAFRFHLLFPSLLSDTSNSSHDLLSQNNDNNNNITSTFTDSPMESSLSASQKIANKEVHNDRTIVEMTYTRSLQFSALKNQSFSSSSNVHDLATSAQNIAKYFGDVIEFDLWTIFLSSISTLPVDNDDHHSLFKNGNFNTNNNNNNNNNNNVTDDLISFDFSPSLNMKLNEDNNENPKEVITLPTSTIHESNDHLSSQRANFGDRIENFNANNKKRRDLDIFRPDHEIKYDLLIYTLISNFHSFNIIGNHTYKESDVSLDGGSNSYHQHRALYNSFKSFLSKTEPSNNNDSTSTTSADHLSDEKRKSKKVLRELLKKNLLLQQTFPSHHLYHHSELNNNINNNHHHQIVPSLSNEDKLDNMKSLLMISLSSQIQSFSGSNDDPERQLLINRLLNFSYSLLPNNFDDGIELMMMGGQFEHVANIYRKLKDVQFSSLVSLVNDSEVKYRNYFKICKQFCKQNNHLHAIFLLIKYHCYYDALYLLHQTKKYPFFTTIFLLHLTKLNMLKNYHPHFFNYDRIMPPEALTTSIHTEFGQFVAKYVDATSAITYLRFVNHPHLVEKYFP